jgi:class 3 adenylate cyclase/pimeloyl-ACP methyl ester carboxylesterase
VQTGEQAWLATGRQHAAILEAVEGQPETRYATTRDGVAIAYHVLGDAELDVVWTPAVSYPFDLLWEEPSFAHFASRVAGFSRSIWVTPRGLGGSGGQWTDNFTDDTSVDDMTALLDDCGAQKVVFAGSAVGGPFAIRYAHARPDRVRSLVLIDTYARFLRAPDYPFGFPEEKFELFLTGLQTWGAGASVHILAPSRAADPLFRERFARIERLGQPPDQAAASLRQALSVDVRHLLPELEVPTLVLHRRDDRYIRADCGRYLAASIPGAKYVELAGEDNLFFVGDVDAVVDELEEFLTGARQSPEGEVVTRTILFTDIVSSTERVAELGHRAWSALTAEHDAIVRAALRRHRGREIKTIGDGFLAIFDANTRAVRCAAEIVAAAGNVGLEVRAGVHTGEVELLSDDVAGLAVNIAKRVCDLAAPSQVLVSETVRGALVGAGITLADHGTHVLKGVPGDWRLFFVDV